MSEIIKVEHLRYVYNAGMPDETAALDDVSFSIEKGDFVGVMGSTGSGKSTLIAHFNGLNRPTSGKIIIDGRDMWAEGEPLVHFGFIHIYREGVSYAVLMAVRIVALIAGTSLLTYTTSPIVLTDAIEALLKPFAKLHLPVHELAMMMTIALRFIPLLIDETEKIMNAQKARGAMLDNGKFMDRIKALVPVLIPLFISAFRRADELAMAMECRCYHGGEGRTRLKVLKFGALDVKCAVVLTLCLAVILSTRWLMAGI